MEERIIYKVEDLFEDIDGDPNNVLFKIPPEICQQMGWGEGTVVKIEASEGQLIISKA